MELVEAITATVFGTVAMVKGPHWRATKAEMADWSADAARILDKVSADRVDKALDAVAGVNVFRGLAGMVMERAAEDRKLAAAKAPQNRAVRPQDATKRPEGVQTPAPPAPAADAPTEPEPATVNVAPGALHGIYA